MIWLTLFRHVLFLLITGVGFRVGGQTQIKYIVIQIHYVNPLPGTYSMFLEFAT